MYNGIGILTPRGSGTSGYVQTNKFNLRPGAAQRVDLRKLDETGPTQRQPNKGILDHNRKREIELEIAKLEEDLLEEGCAIPGSLLAYFH
jgi:serine/arginine repetitive matrix protein 2